ncbi:MAG TPA: hypothetical protein ENN66_10220 [Proteobacteria bacterium]|nr:hypothetical protein [Pseudomonadota bacterium]
MQATRRFVVVEKIDKIKDRLKHQQLQLEALQERQLKLAEKETHVKEMIASEGAYLAQAESSRQQAAGGVGSESKALVLLMIDNQLEQARLRLRDYQNSLLFELPQERRSLDQSILELQLGKERLAKELDDLQNQLVALENKRLEEIEEIKKRCCDKVFFLIHREFREGVKKIV